MTEQVTIKLIGAARFVSMPAGITLPVERGQTVKVDKESADYLLTLVYHDKANNAHPLFTTDLNALTPAEQRLKTLEEAVKDGSAARRRSR